MEKLIMRKRADGNDFILIRIDKNYTVFCGHCKKVTLQEVAGNMVMPVMREISYNNNDSITFQCENTKNCNNTITIPNTEIAAWRNSIKSE